MDLEFVFQLEAVLYFSKQVWAEEKMLVTDK